MEGGGKGKLNGCGGRGLTGDLITDRVSLDSLLKCSFSYESYCQLQG